MSREVPNRSSEIAEGAQGYESHQAPRGELRLDEAIEQAGASQWLPPGNDYDWPSVDTHRGIVGRRRDLYGATQTLESCLARASGHFDWAEQVRLALYSLQMALQEHVAEIEGPEGLFAEVVEQAPHLSAAVDSLRTEHEELIAACRSALETMRAGNEASAAGTRGDALALLGRLAIHRQSGSELLFDVYDVDLAAAD